MPRQFRPPGGVPKPPTQRPAKPTQRPSRPYKPKPLRIDVDDAAFTASMKAVVDALAKSAALLTSQLSAAAIAAQGFTANGAWAANVFSVPRRILQDLTTTIINAGPDRSYRLLLPPSMQAQGIYALPGTRALDVRVGNSRPRSLIGLLHNSKFIVTVDEKMIGACFACDEAAGWADCYEVDTHNRPILRSGFTEPRTFRLRGVVRLHRVITNPPSFEGSVGLAIALIQAEFPKVKL